MRFMLLLFFLPHMDKYTQSVNGHVQVGSITLSKFIDGHNKYFTPAL